MTDSKVIIKNQFRADGTSDGNFSIKGFFELLHQFETICEVQIQARFLSQGVCGAGVGNPKIIICSSL